MEGMTTRNRTRSGRLNNAVDPYSQTAPTRPRGCDAIGDTLWESSAHRRLEPGIPEDVAATTVAWGLRGFSVPDAKPRPCIVANRGSCGDSGCDGNATLAGCPPVPPPFPHGWPSLACDHGCRRNSPSRRSRMAGRSLTSGLPVRRPQVVAYLPVLPAHGVTLGPSSQIVVLTCLSPATFA
jgi:hypothetical protein